MLCLAQGVKSTQYPENQPSTQMFIIEIPQNYIPNCVLAVDDDMLS